MGKNPVTLITSSQQCKSISRFYFTIVWLGSLFSHQESVEI